MVTLTYDEDPYADGCMIEEDSDVPDGPLLEPKMGNE